MTTHTVFNQSAPRVDINEFTCDPALVEAVDTFAPDADTYRLGLIGAEVGTASYQHDADLANRITPVHTSHDRWATGSTRWSSTRPTTASWGSR